MKQADHDVKVLDKEYSQLFHRISLPTRPPFPSNPTSNTPNSISLNSISLNSISLNSVPLNSVSLNSIPPNSTPPNSTPPDLTPPDFTRTSKNAPTTEEATMSTRRENLPSIAALIRDVEANTSQSQQPIQQANRGPLANAPGGPNLASLHPFASQPSFPVNQPSIPVSQPLVLMNQPSGPANHPFNTATSLRPFANQPSRPVNRPLVLMRQPSAPLNFATNPNRGPLRLTEAALRSRIQAQLDRQRPSIEWLARTIFQRPSGERVRVDLRLAPTGFLLTNPLDWSVVRERIRAITGRYAWAPTIIVWLPDRADVAPKAAWARHNARVPDELIRRAGVLGQCVRRGAPGQNLTRRGIPLSPSSDVHHCRWEVRFGLADEGYVVARERYVYMPMREGAPPLYERHRVCDRAQLQDWAKQWGINLDCTRGSYVRLDA
ncbi:hypothetical protein AAE478_007034 [Parahypoxylon ruwenzoriense]